MNLHDQLERDLHSRHPYDAPSLDVDRLSRVARSQGTRALRRRRAATAVAGLAAATVVGVSVLSYGGAGTSGVPVAGSGGNVTSPAIGVDFDPAHPGPTGPTTGRGLAAALWWALDDLQAGTASTFGGQAGHESHASLEWDAADGLGVSQIDINVQDDTSLSRCAPEDVLVDCQVTTLADGTLQKTYEEHTADGEETGITRTVQLMRPDGVRIAVSSTNGYDRSGNEWDVTRPQPPLTTDQLIELAEQPFWGATLPTTFLEAGRDLAPYVAQGTRWPDAPDAG